MKINLLKIIIFSFVVFFISVFWMGLKKDNNYNTTDLTGNVISSFKLPSIYNGDMISDEALKQNQFTLINFFASWCAPCRLEHKYLIKFANHNKNIKVLGVNFKDKKKNVINFLNELGNPYDYVVEDRDGKASILFGIYGIPETILINKELIIIKKIVGPIDEKQFKEIINLIQ
ncbi:MAG: DsbE family thiol:disulfide interchange protein [Pelagibacteraceae bacterium]|jgi:cytochrome c biogenesis protein CcmG, thiol:disulfide interchange protein DsbE|nr:DsbE family thiol:disulfide interchange protein [Pelagibacteraceae bacterium]